MKEPPTFTAHRDGPHLVFRCPYCERDHLHGAGQNFGDGDGHRVAHCTADSPLKDSGYILIEGRPGDATTPK